MSHFIRRLLCHVSSRIAQFGQIRTSARLILDRINYTQRINHRSYYFEFEVALGTILWGTPED